MDIGLIGLPKSGKTTIFNALTGDTSGVSPYQSGKVEPNRATVQVSDSRVDRLAAMYNPKKTVYAQINIVDFAGLSAGTEGGEVFSGKALGEVKTCDALALVLNNFGGEESSPTEELSTLIDELLLSDQISLERRLERVREDIKKGKKDPGLGAEEKLLSMVHERVEAGEAIRDAGLNADQLKRIAGYSFLTAKPFFAILN